ncbi:hypothetical protein BpHYR1_048094 [Brachionus plicatilis]|uniref:Uncharacterized protein n=1 Tax=Brachionus plicatilis TaxID=10195 RepID=A0A3M7S9N2_BRAPC|nr:hypothetical protein BpHYR1_048094 [Brachionus plicatilis]
MIALVLFDLIKKLIVEDPLKIPWFFTIALIWSCLIELSLINKDLKKNYPDFYQIALSKFLFQYQSSSQNSVLFLLLLQHTASGFLFIFSESVLRFVLFSATESSSNTIYAFHLFVGPPPDLDESLNISLSSFLLP